MGIAGVDEKKIWQQYSEMNAVKNNKIFIVDPYLICSPTPENFIAALEMVIGFLHPQEVING